MSVFISELTDTWNNANTNFVGIGISITDTNSSSGSKPVKITYNNTDYFTIDKSGNVVIYGTITGSDVILNGNSLSNAGKLFGMMGNVFGGI